MPIKQLRVIEKIKYLVSNSVRTKKQIVAEVEKNAEEHRALNQIQEKEDNDRVDHAQMELKKENEETSGASSRTSKALATTLAINIIFFLIVFVIIWYFFYR